MSDPQDSKKQLPGLLQNSYAFVRKSGFLNTWAGSRLFTTAYFLYKKHLEDSLRHLFLANPNLLRGGDVLDIGANLGYTADLMAKGVDPGRKVYAFEPEPFNYAILQRIARRSGAVGRIIPEQAAVGENDGTVDLWLNAQHHADHRIVTDVFERAVSRNDSVRVPMVSVDNYLGACRDPISFIKIDVQGFELPVCKGMSATLERNPKAAVVLEYSPSGLRELGFDPSELIGFMLERGFDCSLVRPDGALEPGVPNISEDGSYVDLLFRRN